MKELYSVRSQNGRWGLAIVSEHVESLKTPLQVSIAYVGKIEGLEVYHIEPTEEPQWLLLGDDLESMAGCRTIVNMGLQNFHSCVSLVLLSEQAIVRSWGYDRRSSRVTYYERGEAKDVPASILLALGLIPDKAKETPIEPPPKFEIGDVTTMAAAFKKAGYPK